MGNQALNIGLSLPHCFIFSFVCLCVLTLFFNLSRYPPKLHGSVMLNLWSPLIYQAQVLRFPAQTNQLCRFYQTATGQNLFHRNPILMNALLPVS